MDYNTLVSSLQNLINIKVSQQSMANALGVGQTAISGRAKRNSNFTMDELLKLERAYGLPIGVLSNISDTLPENGINIQNLEDNTHVILCDKTFISSSENIFWLTATGDSMSPVINDNDIVLLDVSKTEITNGGIFLFEINGQQFIKRLRLRVTGELDIISDNSSYPIETIKDYENIKIVGRVIKNLSKGL